MESCMIRRPFGLPAAVRPSLPVVPAHASVVAVPAARARLSQVHQVPVQAELAQNPVYVGGSNGTTGFLGSTGAWSAKQHMTDGARGVPPRGRPV